MFKKGEDAVLKNREKYRDDILTPRSNYCNFITLRILKPLGLDCNDISCTQCELARAMWLDEEYKEPTEPEVDWGKVKVDTPILVKSSKHGSQSNVWLKRHFAKYENGKIYTWSQGTSWTTENGIMTSWEYAKLAEGDEI